MSTPSAVDYIDTEKNRSRALRDVIYGFIELSNVATSFIDKPEFQALRQLRQLGITHYVFPSANHTRFEHSIGVYHLTGEFIDTLIKNQPELQIDNRLREIIKLAGLLHDIGHVAFSHLFDHYIAHDLGVPDHEERSVKLLKYMVKKYIDIKLEIEEVDLIVDLIGGKERVGYPKWIFQIVSNSKFDLDVDKCDYIVRDSYYIGFSSNLQIDRIFSFARVMGDTICFHEKISFQLIDIFVSRYRLHKEVYRHPVVIGIELLIVDILKSLSKIQRWKELFSDDHSWRNITDSVFDTIPILYTEELKDDEQGTEEQMNEEPMDEETQNVLKLYNRLYSRDLYKRTNISNELTTSITSIIGFTGKANDNPMEKILFYNDKGEIFKINPNSISVLFSNVVSEVQTDTYSKN